MASQSQTKYIQDLAVLKTKEFKEVKELLFANDIISADNGIVNNAATLAEICNALTDMQASKLIDVLINTKIPARARTYSDKRIKKTITILDDIKSTIDDWGF